MKSDILYPECPECGLREGISKVEVGPPRGVEELCNVKRQHLACGHVRENPSLELDNGVVMMLEISRPEVIERVGDEA